MAELSDAAAITFTVGYFGASGSSSMAAARSALPVAGYWGATNAAAPESARAITTDLRCTAVRVMHHEYLHSVTYCMVMFVRGLLRVKTRCQGLSHLHEDIEFLTKTPDERTPSERIHQVQHRWHPWMTAGAARSSSRPRRPRRRRGEKARRETRRQTPRRRRRARKMQENRRR